MKVILQPKRLILAAESEEQRIALAEWLAAQADVVWAVPPQADEAPRGGWLRALGPRAEVCREPINVTSRAAEPGVALIANFAATPFALDGEDYASVEGFWQGLKFPPAERRRVARFAGSEAKRAGQAQGYPTTIEYQDQAIVPGTWAHWQLMHRACWAKFSQWAPALEALLATGTRPLTHVVRRDSRTIPGVIMADIWMRIRVKLVEAAAVARHQ